MTTAHAPAPADIEIGDSSGSVPESQLRGGRANAIEVWEVSKSFGDTTVIDDITLSVEGGQIFGLIGPSGCGKTTLVRLLVGLSKPTSGSVRVSGVAPTEFSTRDRERIGFTPQGFFLYPTLTVHENAKFVAGLYGVGWRQKRRRIREVLTLLELWDDRGKLAKDISGGMQRRLSLACSLFHRPDIIFVDEPTAGLDPVLRQKVWEHLHYVRDHGTTIFLTTQYIDESAECDTVAMLNRGRLVAVGTPDELRRQALGGDALDVQGPNFERADIVALWALPCVNRVDWNGRNVLRLAVENVGVATVAVTNALAERGTEVTAVHPYLPTFDEVFMELVADK